MTLLVTGISNDALSRATRPLALVSRVSSEWSILMTENLWMFQRGVQNRSGSVAEFMPRIPGVAENLDK